ncbi:hypothetical protein MB46_19675 (plasmid) [Arthrobacter alpinus]|nr:hypothetical protein MB46_19675 [Arthrobacter alpinus]
MESAELGSFNHFEYFNTLVPPSSLQRLVAMETPPRMDYPTDPATTEDHNISPDQSCSEPLGSDT